MLETSILDFFLCQRFPGFELVCHLMNGHTEHRSGKWHRKELYRSTMQALEGRCSTRSNLAKEFEMQIREFTATVRVILL
ncbi:unnamed protein product [Onchocerca flexuosa]|uniref:XRN2-binding (XTBD) domain-containing protein n=1 Tax=Onchocerca flexuosa TaxID=387005 RepID=A0A183HG56_9BILA|nr:unnamed protein product [Onchocerca flexuosa]